MRRFALLTLVLVSMLPPLVADSVATVVESDSIRHLQSWALFPSHTELIRGQTILYNPDGTDISVEYNARLIPSIITLYVFPALHSLETEYEQSVSEIYRLCAPEEPVTPASSVEALNGAVGYEQEFTYTDYLHGKRQPLVSRLEIYRHGDWFVMVRVTTERAHPNEGGRLADKLLASMEWPQPIRELPVTVVGPSAFSYHGERYADAWFGHFRSFVQTLQGEPGVRADTSRVLDAYLDQAHTADAALMWASVFALGVPMVGAAYLQLSGEFESEAAEFSTGGKIAGGTIVAAFVVGVGFLVRSLVSDPGFPTEEVGLVNRDLMGSP